ncbi:YybH family protein [Streptomyces acidicola]|uniref:YybH family protein n=1 Tax=Streptomyces acidicola TaxID=2596892 RepID=UPI00343C9E42
MSQLTDDLEKRTELYVEAFNAGDAKAIEDFYTEEAVAVWEPGKPLTGQARRDYQREFLSHGPRMTAVPRQVFVTGDTALMIVDWVIDTVDETGAPERMQGIGVDVLRLCEDNVWRYAVDDPFGQQD